MSSPYAQASYSAADPSAVVGILANSDDVTTRKITVVSGQDLVAGSVIGQVTEGARTATGAAGVPAPAAATITASPPAALNTKLGVHNFVCIVGGAGAASKWRHVDPDGDLVGVASGNTAYAGGGLSALTITDAGTDPTPGETFTVTVTEGASSDSYKLSAAAAIDGSQTPDLVLAQDADATGGAVEAIAYETATVVSSALTLGAGHTIASIREGLRGKGIKIDDGD